MLRVGPHATDGGPTLGDPLGAGGDGELNGGGEALEQMEQMEQLPSHPATASRATQLCTACSSVEHETP